MKFWKYELPFFAFVITFPVMCFLRHSWQSPVHHHCPHCCSISGHLLTSWHYQQWNLDFSWKMEICFSILITNLKILNEVVKRMKHLRWLVITGFGLVAAWALGRTSSLYKKQDAWVQSTIQIFNYSYFKVCNTHCVHLEMDENPEVKIYIYFIIQFVHTVTIKWMNEFKKKKKKSDLGWEGELGRFCFAGSVNGCERRGPWLSHFLRKKKVTWIPK